MARRDLIRKHRLSRTIIVLVAIVTVCLSGNSIAWLSQSGPVPQITSDTAVYDPDGGRLVIKGRNFQKGATVNVSNAQGPITFGSAKIKGSKKVILNEVPAAEIKEGIDVSITNPDGVTSSMVHITVEIFADESKLTADDVRKIISQAVAQADASGLKVTIAVTDKEGNVLGVFKMNGARNDITIGIGTRCAAGNSINNPTCGLEGIRLPNPQAPIDGTVPAAISKAGTAGVLSTAGGAFCPRIANFLLQEHIPPGIEGASSGPLFGVQFSQLLCSDVNPSLPLGLAADPGGIPLYKNGQPVGGVGVEGDGKYALANRREERIDKPVEELIALAAGRGFEPSPEIVDTLFPGGLRLPYANQQVPPALPTTAFGSLNGSVVAPFGIRDTPASKFKIVNIGGSIPVRMKIDVPIIASPTAGGLTAAEVEKILVQGIQQALITRALIHQPVGSHIEVSVGVCDQNGVVIGAASTLDAPISSYDIAVQKGRSAAFFSNSAAGSRLRNGGLGKYVDAANKEGLNLDGSVAISGRCLIFLSRPFLPDGIDGTENGPFSNPIEDNSAFNTGLQLDTVLAGIVGALGPYLTTGVVAPRAGGCSPIIGAGNGFQVRQASVPLYKNGRLVGGVGCSGDGDQQEDIVVGFASAGFEAEPGIRSDRVLLRGNIRLPWLKYPRHPNL
ncbi:MAG TPA: heme-binding protein [Blastocatellia bacterium]|nr:heme-binding protein [Blastocatellia bacterium]